MTASASLRDRVDTGSARLEGVAASAWARTMLAGRPTRCRVVGVSGPAGYVLVADDAMLAVETVRGVGLPNAMTVGPDGPGLAGLDVGSHGVIGGGALRIGARTLTVRRWWDPHPRVGTVDPLLLRRRGERLPVALGAGHEAYGLGPPVGRLRAAALRRDGGAVRGVVADLVGRGPGSTPAGDDVLAGLLATLRAFADVRDLEARAFADAVARATAGAADRTTVLSATLLRCADDGAVVGAARRVLRALAGHGQLDPAVAALAAVGHTSGRDLLTGMAIAVDLLTAERK